MFRTQVTLLACVMMAGCATSQKVQRLDKSTEYVINCWYFDWGICYDKARKICPSGYKYLSQDDQSNGKEVRIACPDV
jgi:hypothetical protein